MSLPTKNQLTDIVNMIVDECGSRLSQGFADRAESQQRIPGKVGLRVVGPGREFSDDLKIQLQRK
jgi:hypothetical protein